MLASGFQVEPSAGTRLRAGVGTGAVTGSAFQFDGNDLASRAVTSDGADAPRCGAHQQEGHPMSQPSNGNGNHGPAGISNAPGDSPFNKPAPEGAAKKVSEVLGEIVWLMSQSPLHKQFFISDLEWFVMTPVLLQQFRMFYDKDKPIGVVFWATVDEEVEQRLAAGTTRLRPQDWKSGERAWVVEAIAPFGGAEEMVRNLQTNVFVGRSVKFVASTASGRTIKTS